MTRRWVGCAKEHHNIIVHIVITAQVLVGLVVPEIFNTFWSIAAEDRVAGLIG